MFSASRAKSFRTNLVLPALLRVAIACQGMACNSPFEQPVPPPRAAHEIFKKTGDFTEDERRLIERARAIIRERRIDVAGLEESLSLFGSTWYVIYMTPGHSGPGGGGWSVAFRYPSGEFLAVEQDQ
jgi:hypothetical protein